MKVSPGWLACVATVVLAAGCPETSAPGPSDSGAAKTTATITSATTKATPSATASVTAATSATPTAAPLLEKDVFTVATKDAGIAGVGFEIKGIAGHGWSVTTTPAEGDLLRLSGPPGGPLGLRIFAYDEKSGDNVKLFEKIVPHKPNLVGQTEKVDLAGEPREAQSFRNGESMATAAYCLIRLPAKPGAKTGLVFLADSGMQEKGTPSCKQALDAPALKPIVASFKLVP